MTETNLIEDLRLLSPPHYGAWLAVLLVPVLAAGVVFLLRRRRRPELVLATAGPGDTASWDEVVAALERLTALLKPECSREYAIRSTGILRQYVERRYGLCAPKLTTEEFLVHAARSPALPPDPRQGLARFLELCDLFKFGRYLASTDELTQLHTAAVGFVMASRPSPVELREGAA